MVRIASLFVLALAAGGSAQAAEAVGAGKGQASRMSQCSADAKEKGLKGDARKEFMSQCLRSSDSQAATKECAADAAQRGLTGDKRREFLKSCVGKSKAAGPVG